MNLDSQDIELLKTTVEGAVAKATAALVTKDEFRQFRDEQRAQWEKTYSREMIDQFRAENKDEHDRMWAAIKREQDILSNLWERTSVRIGVVIGLALQAWELWQILK